MFAPNTLLNRVKQFLLLTLLFLIVLLSGMVQSSRHFLLEIEELSPLIIPYTNLLELLIQFCKLSFFFFLNLPQLLALIHGLLKLFIVLFTHLIFSLSSQFGLFLLCLQAFLNAILQTCVGK